MPLIGVAAASASGGASSDRRRAGELRRRSATGSASRQKARQKRPHMVAPPGTLSRRTLVCGPPANGKARWHKRPPLSSERAEKERFCHSHGGAGSSGARTTPSRRAARCHGLRRGARGAGGGAVSRMKRSSAATTAAASSSEAVGATIVSLGRRFTGGGWLSVACAVVPELPVLDHDAVLAAVPPATAIER